MYNIVIAVLVALAATGSHAESGDMLCVTEDHVKSGVEVKAGPSVDADTVMIIGAGRAVIEFDRESGWVSVGVDKAGGRQGYVEEVALGTEDLDGRPCGS